MIFESHAHYDDEAFNEDRDSLLSSMRENGIEYIVNVAADFESIDPIYDLTQKYDFVYGTVGIHPGAAKDMTQERFEYLKKAVLRDKVVAIGEIGLDYYWEKEEYQKANQKDWFIKQLQLAREVDKPVIIHSREAAADTLEIMKQEAADRKVVIHCYSYSAEMAKVYAKMGYYFGIGGVLTYNNARTLVETVECVPIEQLLLETDCPYLSPVPNRGKRNSSLNLPYVAQKIAEIKNMSYDAVVEITSRNAKRFFFGEK
jgi:TatD DNase family protein